MPAANVRDASNPPYILFILSKNQTPPQAEQLLRNQVGGRVRSSKMECLRNHVI